jgi:hypothetical protein
MNLVEQLMSRLNISEAQAQGGAALLFHLAKSQLGHEEFTRMASSVEDIDDLMQAAPSSQGGIGGVMGGMASTPGDPSTDLNNEVAVANGFAQLDLDQSMIEKFVPIMLSFMREQGDESKRELLEKGFRSITQ